MQVDTLQELLSRMRKPGRLEWIGLAPRRREPMRVVQEARAIEGHGLEGEHHAKQSGKNRSKRQVTLIQAEHLPAVASILGLDAVPPELMRRNLVVSGINLLALKGRGFRVGSVLLLGTGPCEPCSRLEESLGPGGFNAARGHGGITALVVEGGLLRVGDPVLVDPG